MSTDNQEHRDALYELLADDEDRTDSTAQPLTRRQLRDRQQQAEHYVPYEEDSSVPETRNRDNRTPIEYDDAEDKEHARNLAEVELRRLLDLEPDDVDDLPAPAPRATAASRADIEDLLGLDDEDDDFNVHVDARRNPAPAPVPAPVQSPQVEVPAPVHVPIADDGSVDYGAWMDEDDTEDVKPTFREPEERSQATDHARRIADAQVSEPEVEEVRHEPSFDAAVDKDAPISVDLVPEKRKLKAGLFASKQERVDSREERDAVTRLNELQEKISKALVAEQQLQFRISDLEEEAGIRGSLAEVRRSLESESAQLQEVRNELERASVRV